ncbi:response regulator [Flavobacterium enshiense]|uniref:response regulator n=1 Tax=Flavobacterium enshiense TaxID=1341165 RepID=UPI00345C9407
MQNNTQRSYSLTVFKTNIYGYIMSQALTILVVDDHPMTADAYTNLIASLYKENKPTFQKAFDGTMAFKNIMMNIKTGVNLDVALVDISIPPYEEEKIFSGIDIAKIIRLKFPDCRIIMLTMHTETLILNKVYKTIYPEGFISKNDIDFSTFPNVINNILNGDSFISKTIYESLNGFFKETIKWDEFDTEIILLLDKGIKTKELPNYIDLSLSSIEKRKANIKRVLLDQKSSDEELINKCKILKLI